MNPPDINAIARKWGHEYLDQNNGVDIVLAITSAITEATQEQEKRFQLLTKGSFEATQVMAKENAGLRQRITELEKINDAKDAQERIWINVANEARKRITELEQDKARLDWLESNAKIVTNHNIAADPQWTINNEWAEDRVPTLRLAVDSAMSAERKDEK